MSSKRHVRRKQCDGKIRHASAQDAGYHRHLLNVKDPAPMSVYRCKFCGAFHVGRMSARRLQGMRARKE